MHNRRKLTLDYMAAKEFIKEFDDMISFKNYLPQQMYNRNANSLNFKALSQKSLECQKESCAPGFKLSKETVIVLERACSNGTADNKLPLMLIGK